MSIVGGATICFTIFPCISPDLDGLCFTIVWTKTGRGTSEHFDICFTICLFISPDLDGNRAPERH